MKSFQYLTTTAAVLVLTLAPAMAGTANTNKPQVQSVASSPYYLTQMKESGQMMGQISLARHALDLGLKDDAVDHIKKAEKLASILEKGSPEFHVTSTLKAGGKVYAFTDEYKHYLIPIVDDLFTTADYNIKVKNNPINDKIAESDTEIGRYTLSLDIRTVKAALNGAESLAKDGKVIEAAMALDGIYDGASESLQEYQDPLWAVHDNLMASYDMIMDKDYDGARFALKTAEKELKAVEKAGRYTTAIPRIKLMHDEILTLHNSLKDDDPTLMQKAEKTISGWLTDIRKMHKDKKAEMSKSNKSEHHEPNIIP